LSGSIPTIPSYLPFAIIWRACAPIRLGAEAVKLSTAPASASPARRLHTYASFVRFEHTLFSLPLILAGIFSVPGPIMPVGRWILIAVAAVGARTAAMTLNRLIDRDLDALNPRTQGRELPSGIMTGMEAFALLLVSALVYLGACAALGPWYLKVAWVPLFVFTAYPYLKRITPLCHWGVGAALALAPLAGYAAAHPDLARPLPAIWLAVFAFAWVSGFDIIYATLDEKFDRAQGVHSMVAWLGRKNALKLSRVLHAVAWGALIGVVHATMICHGPLGGWSLWSTVGVTAAVGALLWLEQKWAEDVNLAFFKVNLVVGFGVLAAVLTARACGGF
jgi:4-hydroxybenzoate polyprenyltransferase